MAKRVILEAYTFTPSTNTIVTTGKTIRQEQLLLITNVTRNTVIYNFSDPTLIGTVTNSINTTTGQETTTIVVNYNTTSMSSSDRISIVVEETYYELMPAEVMRDPVDKLRVSTPQALIDTDFEYGVQPTKWDSTCMINGRMISFLDPTNPLTITNITASSKTVTVTGTKASFTATSSGTVLTVSAIASGIINIGDVIVGTSISGTVQSYGANTSGGLGTYNMSASSTQASPTACTATPAVGYPLFVQGTLDVANADGWWVVDTSTGTTFTYLVTGTPAATLYDSQKSYVWNGFWYSGAAIPHSNTATSVFSLSGTVATVTTSGAHGLRPGDGISIVGATATSGTLNGPAVVATTPTNNTFTFASTAGSPATAVTSYSFANNTGSIFPRILGYVQHRAFDGGVQFSNVNPAHGYQIFRQTRRQFRYQSGKGIQFSTGTILKPGISVDKVTSSGTTATVYTRFPHGFGIGCGIAVSGSTDATATSYNGTGVGGGSTYSVVSVPSLTSFTYTMTSSASSATATGFPITISPTNWYGNTNRVGMFDHQNGFFFEFDGQTLWCVKRSSTTQITGLVTVTQGSQSVVGTTGNNQTFFTTQLKPNDWIVIRGLSYQVVNITSDSQMYIYPEYRGATPTALSSIVSKTIDQRYAGPSTLSGVTNSWNIDKMDGTGHSRMTIDLTKMQMLYADYTWYGAGAIRFGFKNNRGEVIYCHRIPNNNVNTEAYMRSGNLVARYEINHMPLTTVCYSWTITTSTGAITVADASNFPASGTLAVGASGATGGVIEYMTYTKTNATTLTITARGQTGGSAATNFNSLASTTTPLAIELYSPQAASTISHWGSSVIMDGRYDDDKSLVFNTGNNAPLINLTQNVRVPILSIRIAPSIDNGLGGTMSTREIINRMQLTLRQMDVYTSGTAFRMDVILNGQLSGGTFASVGGSSLAQVAYHTASQTISGGESIFGFFTSNTGAVTQDLSIVRDIGNSIFGGGRDNNVPTSPLNKYPDGPDVITVCCTNITSTNTNTINSRLSWTEAQA